MANSDYDNMFDFSRLYFLCEAGLPGALRVNPKDNDAGEPLLRGEIVPSGTVEFVRDSGRRCCDFLGSTGAHLLLSERVHKLLRREGVTGWRAYQVVIYRGSGTIVGGYHGLSIIGKCGRMGGVRPRRFPKDCPVLPEIYVDDATWDGSDIFMPTDTRFICVQERVKTLIESIGATNVCFTRMSEYVSFRVADNPMDNLHL